MNSADDLLARLEVIASELQQYACAYPALFPATCSDTPESVALDNLLLAATHETASQLGFLLQDIMALRARLALMSAWPQFDRREQLQIGEQGWSLALLQQLHQSRAAQTLDSLSREIKAFHCAWQALPALRLNMTTL